MADRRTADEIGDRFARRAGGMFDLRRTEWLLVGLWVGVVVLVNKVVIEDTGNTWAMLLILSFWTGLLLVHAVRALRKRLG